MIDEINIANLKDVCFTAGSTHVLKTCKINSELFYLKFSDTVLYNNTSDPNLQILNEYLAYKLYSIYPGVSVPKNIHLVSDLKNKKIGLATSNVMGDRGHIVSIKQLGKLMSGGVFVDVFLANWDVSNTDNIIVSKNSATRIDPGGSIDFRARGERKGKEFNANVKEIETMFNPERITGSIFQYSDLKIAASTFLKIKWNDIISAIKKANIDITQELKEANISRNSWNKELQKIIPILKERHSVVKKHCQYILGEKNV